MRAILAATALAVLAGCQTTGAQGLANVDAANAQFETAFAAQDAAALAALYTSDAAVLAPNLSRIDGRSGIQALWSKFFEHGVSKIELKTIEFDVHGPRATEVGSFALTGPDGKGGTGTVRGKYVVVWQQAVDGGWQIYRDIWNYDPPG